MELLIQQGKIRAAGDHRSSYFSQFNLPKVEQCLEEIRPLAEEKRATFAQLVLRWTTLQPAITVTLARVWNDQQAIANAQAINIALNLDEIDFTQRALSKM